MPSSKETALAHYKWGDGCDGWVLVDAPELSVKQERMPPKTREALHYHQEARQFFFIISGTAAFEIDGENYTVPAGEGCYIEAGKKHRISNNGQYALEFILTSHPSTNGDRINCM